MDDEAQARMTQGEMFAEPRRLLYWRTFCIRQWRLGGCGYEGRRKRELKRCHRCAGTVIAIPIYEDS